MIDLSWIQSLFQILKKDEEEEFTEDHIHNDKMGSYGSINSGKELDARISYQYPKNQVQQAVRPEFNRTYKKRKEKRLEEQKIEIVEPVKTVSPKDKIEQPKQKERRGPFHPTEIPSPIFGFDRPKKSTSIVEHELSHFSNELIIEQEILPVVHEIGEEKQISETKVEVFLDEDINLEIEAAPFQNQEIESAQEIALEPPKQAEPKAEERRHLPFNVMMLKQDRLKWEERKKQRVIQQQKDSKPEIHQPPVQAIIKEVEIQQPVQEVIKEVEIQQPVQVIKEVEIGQPVQENIKEVEIQHPVQEIVKKVEIQQPVKEIIKEVEIQQRSQEIIKEIEVHQEAIQGSYRFPSTHLLKPPIFAGNDSEWLQYQEDLLNQTLQNFNVGASVVNVTQGPSVTRFEVQPEPGVKVNKITNLTDDIKLSLAAKDIRIEAPIPGKHTIGIEVPNKKSRPVFIKEIIANGVFQDADSPLTAVMGLDISGKPIVTDLKKMPHGLIAGATGSGKSVCINTILVSLLYKASPEDLKLLLIDPKMVELAPYNNIPHLVSPVITDVKAATAALKWAVEEMERRYELFAHTGVRDINRFNELAIQHKRYSDKLPFIVIIIDELADLMMMSPADVEEAICRIAQKARACGIHLIVATQRPSVDVITGLIKANIPTRIAFSVSSQVDSRTIIDIAGAEKLLGRGDMLFLENGSSKPVRLQGTFVSDEEIDEVVAHVRQEREPDYLFKQDELLKKVQNVEDEDELFYEACEFIIEHGGASTSSLQRRFKIGYNRAARLMDLLEKNGFISGANGSKPREVLITEADLELIQ